ncbi:acyl-CoA dehydrogenase family protein [Pseudonocardia benzenivorans]|jgi:acyl-CoA dehydrogenase|uniref:(R)-benzylsuccinyl-CoA dehydrogenase n=2 Tax=Pseudonocardia TaxID=1847 RepID=F4CYB6_PSEUX|nr:acyl-CoA dehydrogenase family protein [Pseudonocardia dioxanivorans]AEA25556.1 (R)-benzylsuccinyl-CoA dehydrogenase [Pseudonocardia dioxanivorans CB1190]GJF03750.1 acyl-CoA dehydrogenase [Pseudonocardia sp. D17]
MAWDFATDPGFEEKLTWAREFVRDEIYPLEVLDLDHEGFRRVAAPLQEQVKANGLWAAHLDPELGGQGYGQLKLGLLHEVLGTSELAPFVFGCQAPDSGNAELIAVAGTPAQRERWMRPLLDGELLSAFAMTEQGTGSDPRQLTTSARLEGGEEGGEWVIEGRKWCVGNAGRSDFHIVMAVTDPDADPYHRMSMIIVPTTAPGIEVRELGLMNDPNHDMPVWSHAEVGYHDVRVPAENLLGGRGEAFTLAQKRLGPGRIHHCMRWIGVCRRAFDMLCERAVSVDVHGGPLADKQTVQNWVADSAAAIEAARLLTLKAAWTIDQVGASAARTEIAMIKYYGAAVLHDVIDRAIQVHGSLGFSTDMPLEQMYRWARAARIYDGPDEVHRVTVARRLLRNYRPTLPPTEHIPTRRAAALETFRERFDAQAVQ